MMELKEFHDKIKKITSLDELKETCHEISKMDRTFEDFWSKPPEHEIPLVSPEQMLLARQFAFKIETDKKFDSQCKGRWERYWLRCCIRDECNYFFAVIKKCGIDRETDASNIIKNPKTNLWKILKSEEGKKYYKRTIEDWFLRRYNWLSAIEVISGIKKTKRLQIISILVLLMLNLLFLGSITNANINTKYLSAMNKEVPLLITEYQKAGVELYKDTPTFKTLIGSAVKGFPLTIEIISVILLAAIVLCLGIPKLSRFLFPRLLGAMFIGLLPLITQNSMWTFPMKLNWGQVYIISGGAIILTMMYLTYNCSKITSMSCGKSFFRVLPVTLYGLLMSLVLSLVICDIMGWFLIDYDKILYSSAYIGIFGFIYPKIVVFFASTALFIGIFIQIFWEERTVTEPL